MSRTIADDPMEEFFNLEAYRFLGNGAGSTLIGFFVGPPTAQGPFSGGDGWRKGSSGTITIPQANGSNSSVGFANIVFNNTTLSQSSVAVIPPDATGFIGKFSAATWIDVSGGDSPLVKDFEAVAASLPWQFQRGAGDGTLAFGRVNFGANLTQTFSSGGGGSSTGTPAVLPWVDHSGTITLGGTAQTIAPAKAARARIFIVNPLSAIESLWINLDTTANVGTPSIELRAGDIYSEEGSTISGQAISAIAATTGHAFTCKDA